jgi:NAD(P)-dependent dehydrogenase (short-subunit alcohol dehydrogenase family)
MKKLEGKIALITGGTSGIGLASARLFKDQGAKVVVTGRDRNALDEAQRVLGDDAMVLRSDAANLADIDKLMAAIKERFGRLDIVFVNAGVARAGAIEQVGESDFDAMMDINVKGVFFTIQKALPLFGETASVIVTTSIANQLGSPNFSLYAASKAALRSLVKSLALELIGRGVRVNAISPGPIATPIFDSFGLPADVAQDVKRGIAAKSPSQRFGSPDEVANAALFLAADAGYIVGAEIVVDGGMSLL